MLDHIHHFAFVTRTSYLRHVISYHVGRHAFHPPSHDAFAHYADHVRLRGTESKGIRTTPMNGRVAKKIRHDLF
jgi:hypothetical protein